MRLARDVWVSARVGTCSRQVLITGCERRDARIDASVRPTQLPPQTDERRDAGYTLCHVYEFTGYERLLKDYLSTQYTSERYYYNRSLFSLLRF